MLKRALSVSKQADEFLSMVVAAGSIPGERPSCFVSRVSRTLFELVFVRIPTGIFAEPPTYEGVDPHFEGYSRYKFCIGNVAGTYASTPEHVIVLELRLAPQQLMARLEAAA